MTWLHTSIHLQQFDEHAKEKSDWLSMATVDQITYNDFCARPCSCQGKWKNRPTSRLHSHGWCSFLPNSSKKTLCLYGTVNQDLSVQSSLITNLFFFCNQIQDNIHNNKYNLKNMYRHMELGHQPKDNCFHCNNAKSKYK